MRTLYYVAKMYVIIHCIFSGRVFQVLTIKRLVHLSVSKKVIFCHLTSSLHSYVHHQPARYKLPNIIESHLNHSILCIKESADPKPKEGSPWCLTEDYDLSLPPLVNSDTDIMNVDYRVGILEVSEISDVHQFIEMEMMLDLTWLESRMVVDAEAEDWEENGLGEAGALEESITLAESLWLPDTQILMLKKIQSMAVTRKVGGFIVYRNKTVTYSKKYFLKIL